jgi:hypothetical protein
VGNGAITPGKDLEFFETSGEYGTERAWLELLQGNKKVLDIMGIALSSWRKTRDFGRMVLQKAEGGCKIRILLMHPKNPILNQLIYLYGMTYQNVVYEVGQNFSFYENISKESEHIEVRQIHCGLPHFFLTRNDQYAVLIQYLSSQTWGAGPLWRCSKECKLYGVVKDEFETLWDLNKQSLPSGT